jgi:nitronate monooxygenase
VPYHARTPIVQAPLSGGPSTPALTAAVADAGGFGFLASGYKTREAVAEDMGALRALSSHPFGVNLFVPDERSDPGTYAAYADRVAAEARTAGREAGEARYEDDHWEAKLDLLAADPPAVVSFTFGCPSADTVARLKAGGSDVWITVTTPAEAREALRVGPDGLVAQGSEAGGHRGAFLDDPPGEDIGLLALVQCLRAGTDATLVASGGIATGAGVAGALAAGADAAQIGTAFMRCPEAGTAQAHRDALGHRPTRITRAFSGRRARGLVNRFMGEHGDAPSAYPEIHYLTAPLRAAARERGDAEAINLWAGQAHELAAEVPAGQLVRQLAADAERALERARLRLT